MQRFLMFSVLAALTLGSCAYNPRPATYTVRESTPTLNVRFEGMPRFVPVPGTDAFWAENLTGDYNLYRVGNTFYLQRNGAWYQAADADGPYVMVYDRDVPAPVYSAVDYRTRYGDYELHNRGNMGYRGDRMHGGTGIRVDFPYRPTFVRVAGTSAYRAQNPPPGMDIYRYGGVHYALRGNMWFGNNTAEGAYEPIPARVVPSQVRDAAGYDRRAYRR